MGRDTLKVSCNRKGDIIEIKALSFLLDNGFEVFRNESSVGPVDIVALDIKKNDNSMASTVEDPVDHPCRRHKWAR